MSTPTTSIGKLWWLLKELRLLKKNLPTGQLTDSSSVLVFGHFLTAHYARDTGYSFTWEKV